MKKALKILSIVALSILLVMSLTTLIVFLVPPSVEFSEEKLQKVGSNLTFYDLNNNEIDCYTKIKNGVKLEELKDYTKSAFIVIEDKNFYNHSGIDLKRMLKATYNNLISFSYKEGASTISQQLIKNTHLTNEKTLKRKIDEIKLTKTLEKVYSKDQILETYLNTIYFGQNCYGIAEASMRYFDKPCNELTLYESATLSAIIASPSALNPYKNDEKLIKRRNLVLDLMLAQNKADKTSVEKAKSEELILNYDNSYDISDSYIKAVINELETIENFSPYDFSNCKIKTSYDSTVQQTLLNSKSNIESDFQAISLNNQDGSINGYVSTIGEITREAASTVKPWLVYASAMNEGLINQYSIINDEKTNFGDYSPSNYGNKYYGNISTKKALELSLNVPAVKILNTLGTKTAKNYAKKMDIEIESDTLGIALGSFTNTIKLKNLVGAYTTLANFGYYKKPHFINEITSSNNSIIYKFSNDSTQVFSQGTASVVTDILKSATKTGTAKKLSSIPFDIACKTGTNGTTEGNKDCYSIAYTTKNTFGVWLGNRDNKLLDNSITGGGIPTNCISEIVQNVYKTAPPPFEYKGVSYANIDKISYENSGEILLADDNMLDRYTFYGMFPNEHAPTKKSNLLENQTVKSPKIKEENGTVTIDYQIESYQNVKIYLQKDLENTLLYDGNKNSFSYTTKENGLYTFIIEPYAITKSSQVYGKQLTFPSVSITSFNSNNNTENKKSPPNNWWNDDFN